MVLEVLEVRQTGEAFEAKERRPCRRDKRRVGHAGYAGGVLHELDVRGARRQVVIGNDRAHGLTAILAVFGAVDVFVQPGLGDLCRVFEVVEQVLASDIQQLDLDVFTEVGAFDQQLQAFPCRLQRLELRVVENFVHLPAELAVDLADHPIHQAFFYRLTAVMRLEQLGDKRGDPALGNAIGLIIGVQQGLGDDAVEDAAFTGGLQVLRLCLGAHASVSFY